MDHVRALDQISAIHAHLAKGELYRGYRPVPVAWTGIVGLLAAVAQPYLLHATDLLGYCAYWVGIAVLNLLIAGGVILYDYCWRDDALRRRRTRQAMAQFLPVVVGGGMVTMGIVRFDPQLVPLLPGLWALLFGLGLFASRPYLPRALGWVALFYLSAGGVLLVWAADGSSLMPWALGGTFGIGQLATAGVLYWNLERRPDDGEGIDRSPRL